MTHSWASWIATATGGWTIRYVGTVLTDESTGCKDAGYWSGAHLHRGGNTDSPPVFRNGSLSSGYGGIISPTGPARRFAARKAITQPRIERTSRTSPRQAPTTRDAANTPATA